MSISARIRILERYRPRRADDVTRMSNGDVIDIVLASMTPAQRAEFGEALADTSTAAAAPACDGNTSHDAWSCWRPPTCDGGMARRGGMSRTCEARARTAAHARSRC